MLAAYPRGRRLWLYQCQFYRWIQVSQKEFFWVKNCLCFKSKWICMSQWTQWKCVQRIVFVTVFVTCNCHWGLLATLSWALRWELLQHYSRTQRQWEEFMLQLFAMPALLQFLEGEGVWCWCWKESCYEGFWYGLDLQILPEQYRKSRGCWSIKKHQG